MPAPSIMSFAKQTGKSEKEIERLWDKAKRLAKEEGHKESDGDDFYAYVTGILKKMLGIEGSGKKGNGKTIIEEQMDYLFEEDLDVDTTELCQFVMYLFNLRTQLHIWHLQTASMVEHRALQDVYEAIPGLADSIAEGVNGLRGFFSVENPDMVKFGSWDAEIAVSTLEQLRSKADALFTKYANNSIVSAPLSTVATTANAAIYKIKSLDWSRASGNESLIAIKPRMPRF